MNRIPYKLVNRSPLTFLTEAQVDSDFCITFADTSLFNTSVYEKEFDMDMVMWLDADCGTLW